MPKWEPLDEVAELAQFRMVEDGESFWAIAGGDRERTLRFMEANPGIDPTQLQSGTFINVPAADTVVSDATRARYAQSDAQYRAILAARQSADPRHAFYNALENPAPPWTIDVALASAAYFAEPLMPERGPDTVSPREGTFVSPELLLAAPFIAPALLFASVQMTAGVLGFAGVGYLAGNSQLGGGADLYAGVGRQWSRAAYFGRTEAGDLMFGTVENIDGAAVELQGQGGVLASGALTLGRTGESLRNIDFGRWGDFESNWRGIGQLPPFTPGGKFYGGASLGLSPPGAQGHLSYTETVRTPLLRVRIPYVSDFFDQTRNRDGGAQ